LPGADGGVAGILVSSLPRPSEREDEVIECDCSAHCPKGVGGGVAQFTEVPEADGGEAGILEGGKGTALASELPRPPEAAGGHGVADGDGLLAAGLPRPPEADVTLPEGRSAHLMAEAASALVQYVNNPAVRAALLRAQATSQLA